MALPWLAFGVACSDAPTEAAASDPRVRPEWVTGAAALALGTDGRFVYPAPTPTRLPLERADSVARAVLSFLVAVYGDVDVAGPLAERRGGPVHLASLQPCRRRFLSQASVATDTVVLPLSAQRFIGAQLLVSVCNPASTPELLIGVPDVTPSLTIANGSFAGNWSGNGEFSYLPLVLGAAQDGLFLSPEAAVAMIARTSGMSVREIPAPVQSYSRAATRAAPQVAACPLWRVILTRPVRVVSQFRTIVSDTVYVGRVDPCALGAIALFTPSQTQPASLFALFARDSGTTTTFDSVAVRVTQPLRFDVVSDFYLTTPD